METTYNQVFWEYQLQVLILPMRNGNFSLTSIIICANVVLILPMRNGNKSKPHWKSNYKKVLILPMRNGNEILDLVLLKK